MRVTPCMDPANVRVAPNSPRQRASARAAPRPRPGRTVGRVICQKTREGEAEAWEKLAEEKKEDGSPKYIHAADNAQFWRELDADLRKILRDLEG